MADPEVYVTSVATVLAQYPEAVVRKVTHPAHGLPGKLNWLPTVAEIRQACEAEMEPARREMARLHREQEARLLLAGPPEADAEARARAVARWEEQKAEAQNKMTAEQVREDAEKRLREIAQESMSGEPLAIGGGLAAKLATMKQELAAEAKKRAADQTRGAACPSARSSMQ